MKLFSLVDWSAYTVPSALQISLAIPIFILATLLFTWTVTTIRFHLALSRCRSEPGKAGEGVARRPPVLPYAVPWLGHALQFLSEEPGSFWRMLRAKLSANGVDVQICTILLGGQRAHVVRSAAAVQTIFKSKSMSRELFNHQVATGGLGTSQADAERMWPPAKSTVAEGAKAPEKSKKLSMEALNHEHLLSQTAVNALAGVFLESFTSALKGADIGDEWKTVDLVAWMRALMFRSSTTAIFGSEIMKVNPDLAEQYWNYDAGFLTRFYGLPKFLKPEAYAGLNDMVSRTEQWIRQNLAGCDGDPPEEPEWEPMFGAKITRARHRFYKREGVTLRGRAQFDLGLLFGVSGNAIPIIGWVLAHLISPATPETVLPRVLAEVNEVRLPSGEIDTPKLLSQPLLNSIVHETLRHYVDSLVTRQLTVDMTLDGYLLKKGELIMAPSSLSQHDPSFWGSSQESSADVWYAERFIKPNAETGKDEFSSSWTNGKFFPFGGGGYICPGRVFAKQEMLLTLATILIQLNVQFVEYLGTDKNGNTVGLGKDAAGFPKVKRQYAGNGTVQMDGDIRVQLRRK